MTVNDGKEEARASEWDEYNSKLLLMQDDAALFPPRSLYVRNWHERVAVVRAGTTLFHEVSGYAWFVTPSAAYAHFKKCHKEFYG